MDDINQKKPIKISDPQQAYLKARSYCAYQERSHEEVRSKLKEWGLKSDLADEILVKLIDGNFLNEMRFAQTYAGGKFRIKGWGKNKIKHGLKLKGVAEYCIKKALASIDLEEYQTTLQEIIRQKAKTITDKDSFRRKDKLAKYAMSKGYESSLIWDVLGEK